MNEWIKSQLTAMLKLQEVIIQDREQEYVCYNPCWIESVEESRTHFDSLQTLMVDRYNFLAEKILDLRSFADVNRRIRRTGSYINPFETKINFASVCLTLEVQNGYQETEKMIQRAFDELSDKNRICDESNCICQQQFANCPFEQ